MYMVNEPPYGFIIIVCRHLSCIESTGKWHCHTNGCIFKRHHVVISVLILEQLGLAGCCIYVNYLPLPENMVPMVASVI